LKPTEFLAFDDSVSRFSGPTDGSDEHGWKRFGKIAGSADGLELDIRKDVPPTATNVIGTLSLPGPRSAYSIMTDRLFMV
jgi:hypothetical protein